MSQNVLKNIRRPWLRWAALAAVVLVPLAFAGLFIGAVSGISSGIKDIPAAVVNNDQAVTETAADGTKTPVLAGRQLVTELTGAKSAGFSWTITNTKDAKKDLANGTVYAVITVPKGFSKSIVSLSGSHPTKANLTIATDDSHNYLTGSVAQVVGDSLSSAFGQAVTKQYVAGLYSGIGTVGKSLQTAADGASKLGKGTTSLANGLDKLASGTSSLSSGLSQLASGASQSASGAHSLASGTSKYVGGVKSLSSGTRTISNNLTAYTGGVSQISAALSQAADTLKTDPTDATALATIQALAPELATTAGGGTQLAGGLKQVSSGVSTLASNGSSLSSGTASLASGLSQLASGASQSASGAHQLASGTAASASGAHKLADGTNKLASGLSDGAKQVPAASTAQVAQTANVAADPVSVSVDRKNEVSSPGQIIGTLFVPLGLWIGALAVFLVLRPLSRRTLSSTAGNARLVLSTIGRAGVITAAQAVLLSLLLSSLVGVSWALFPAVLLFSIVMALVFTAFHYLLTIGFGRGGLVVSIFLLAVQIVSTGGLYPIQLLAKPFQLVSPFLPLTYGVRGMESIIANSGDAGPAVSAAFALVVFGFCCVVVSLLAVGRVRRARALGLVPAGAWTARPKLG